MAPKSLKLVPSNPPPSAAVPAPPRPLGEHGLALWRAVTGEYGFEDSGGIEVLTAACQALDRAEALREIIDRDGEIIRSKAGPKEHPGLKAELQNRAFVTRCIARLGLDVEPIRCPGRPPGR